MNTIFKSIKIAAFLTFSMLSCALMAQKNFTLTGNVKGLKTGDKVYLIFDNEGKRITDSAQVQQGKFSFSEQISEPTLAMLMRNMHQKFSAANTPDLLTLWIEPGKLALNGIDSLINIKITGSKINEDYNYLLKLRRPGQESPATRKEVLAAILAFIKKNPDSYVSAAIALRMIKPQQEKEAARSALSLLSPKLRNSTDAQRYRQQIETQALVGNLAPDFTQNDPSGNPVKLSDFRGKYVLLDFWASWCKPCRAENPNVVAAYNKFKDKGFTVLGVSLDLEGQKDAWTKAIADDKLTWTHVSDLKFWDNAAVKLYAVKAVPSNFLIDPQGKIIAKDLRGVNLEMKLAEALGGVTEAPDFDYVTVDGKHVKLSSLRGKYVYIDIWATWCAPCKAEIPHLQKLEENYKDKNIEFVSLSVDKKEDAEKWRNYVTGNKLGGIQLMADDDFNSDFIRKFGVNSIPRFILVDPKGNLVSADAMRPSDPALRAQLDKLLN